MIFDDEPKGKKVPSVIRDIQIKQHPNTGEPTYLIYAQVRGDVKTGATPGLVVTRPSRKQKISYVEVSKKSMDAILANGSLNGESVSDEFSNHPEQAKALYANGTPFLIDFNANRGKFDCVSQKPVGLRTTINTPKLPTQTFSKQSFDKARHETAIRKNIEVEVAKAAKELKDEAIEEKLNNEAVRAKYQKYQDAIDNDVNNKTSIDGVVAVNGFKRIQTRDSNGNLVDKWGIDLVADVLDVSKADRLIKKDLSYFKDGMMHFKHLQNSNSDHYQYFDEQAAKTILEHAFDFDDYGHIGNLDPQVIDDAMMDIPYDKDINIYNLNDKGKFDVAKNAIDDSLVFSPQKYPKYQQAPFNSNYGPKQLMEDCYILPTFAGNVASNGDKDYVLDVDNIKTASKRTLHRKTEGPGNTKQEHKYNRLRFDFRLDMSNLNMSAHIYNAKKAEIAEQLSPEKAMRGQHVHNQYMTEMAKGLYKDVSGLAKRTGFNAPQEMLAPINPRELKSQLKHEEPAHVINSHTMAGKQIGLVLNRIQPIDYVNKAGAKRSGFVIDSVKRGDIDSQHNKFDGHHVVNRKRNDGSVIHGQVISNESAEKIFAVNGYLDVKRDDYVKIASRQALVFDANVFRPKYDIKTDFAINPNPKLINESKFAFDKTKHNQSVSEHETTDVNRSRGFDLEP